MIQPSIWEKETFFAPKDIIIVGSGLVGLWSAYYLKRYRPDAKILIIERGLIPTGASTRNAGFACFGSLTELLEDARNLGEQKMLELVAMRYEGLRRIRKTFSKNEIDYERNGGYELITDEQYPKAKTLKNDIGWLNIVLRKAIKDDKIFKLSDDKLKQFGFGQATRLVENKSEAQLHSGKLVQALLRKVQGLGVEVMTQTEAKSFDRRGGKIELHTNHAIPLKAEQLLICTNAFSKQLLPGVDVVPARGQVIVTSPIKKLPFTGCFHFDEGFYYFRNLGNRVLLGGARNKDIAGEQSTEFITTDTIQKELERFLKKVVLPKQHFTIEHSWSGIMAMGSEKLPVIQKVQKDIYCAVRMSGMGVALAPVVGDIIAKQMHAG